MGWLLTFLGNLIGPIFNLLSNRYIIIGVVFTSYVTLAGLLSLSLNSLLASNVFVSDSNLIYVGLFIPSNFTLCINLIVDAMLIKAGYDFAVNKLGFLK